MDLDLRLRLLSGEPINIKGAGHIKPFTVREIIRYGYSDYLARLNIFALSVKDLVKEDADLSGLSVFDILVGFGDKEVHKELVNSISFFFGKEAEVYENRHCIIVGDFENDEQASVIHRENFDEVSSIIKLQNGINLSKNKEETQPKDDKAAQIRAKIQKAEEQVAKKKSKESEGDLDLEVIASAIASKSHSLNKLNVFELTLYQLYDEFKRLDLIDQYDLNIQSMLAGAQNIKLKHWSSKLDDE